MKKDLLPEIDELRARLEAQARSLSRRNAAVQADRRRVAGPLDSDWAEAAVTRENDEVLDELDDEGRAHLERVQDALARIDSGTYGRCASCGGAIATARLLAVPDALNCIECADS